MRDRLHDVGAAYGVAVEAGCVVEYLEGGSVPLRRFLEEPLNLRPLVVAPPETIRRVRGVLRTRDA
jgi:hypothetical protein